MRSRTYRPAGCGATSGDECELSERAAMSWIALSRMTPVMTVTRCTTNDCLRWHAGLATVLCEAHLTTSPTSVACSSREGVHGLCQQEGG